MKGQVHMSADGELTGEIGERLVSEFPAYDVYHDHGKNGVNIASWFGDELHRDTELSQPDIAIIEKESRKVRVLVEVEETSGTPKTVLGDVFAALFGEHITIQGDRFDMGDQTTLIVMVRASSSPEGQDQKQMKYLKQKIEVCQSALTKRSRSVGNLIIDTFTDGSDLEEKLRRYVGAVL